MGEEAFKAAVKARVGARVWVTKIGNQLKDLLTKEDLEKKTLSLLYQDFRGRVNKLDAIQDEVETLVDEADLENEIENAVVYREDKVRKVILSVEKKLKQLQDLDEDNDSIGSTSLPEARLPKLELPVFTGNVKEWREFWDQFSAIVDNTELPAVSKFTYLRSLLGAEAKAAIAGLALTAVNYHAACDLLKERFGRTEQITFAHIQELLAVEVPTRPSVADLWSVYNSVKAHVRSLEALGITGEQFGVILTPLILSRLPSELRMEWARNGAGKEADLNFLVTFLQEEIQRRERSQVYAKESSTSPATASVLHAQENGRRGACAVCERQNHKTSDCRVLKKLSVPERRDKLREVHACFKCLTSSPGHHFKTCQAKCSKCSGRHHSLLCLPKQGSQKQNPPTCNPSMSKSDKTDVVMTTTFPHTDVLLQTLQVSVRGNHGKM